MTAPRAETEAMLRKALDIEIAQRLRLATLHKFGPSLGWHARAAKAMGFSSQRLANYLAGNRTLDAYVLRTFSQQLDVSTDWVIFGRAS